MRYSMLVYLTKMCRTLLEAAQYLHASPDWNAAQEVLLGGAQMLDQIRAVLEEHGDSLKSSLPLDQLAEIEHDWQVQSNRLGKELEQFIQCLPREVSYQVRAVFFTGLGSTWDAMESVYTYMRDDPRFDPVVVLIPVFRRVQQDGQVKQETTYTDYLTPLGIPFVEYSQYSLEQDCPDLAFINQPYESVIPPEFWPENIANHTRLVYLPYFTPFSCYENSREALCQLPVFRYAWKVIGSSLKHHQFYTRYSASGGANMLVTGLPKWDPTVRLRTEPVELPESWRDAVTGRRVFLWNSFYDFNGSSIPFFESIFQWFQEHLDCALIWRTHPMTDTVTKLYYPSPYYERLQKYISLTDMAPNMIFDREESYEFAFFCADAQISDLSSMMYQYMLLDKPVLYIKTSGRGKIGAEAIVDNSWMDQAENAGDILRFLEEIRNGTDRNKALRESICRRDLPLADGQCGKRVGETIWALMHQEDQLSLTWQKNQSRDGGDRGAMPK